ncbi:MAG: tellurite resistance/C4-dicarboxylate transporter family protein [Methylocapsa sp.]|nr:tellurite resistance/C4-dicarboxylate transporter family protein [Methylocapsa sp.]
MATGIVSNALFLEDYRRLSAALFRLNAAAYPWLAILLILRALRFPGAVWSDLVDTRRVFSFFSLIAANGVFGGGLCLRGVHVEALELWLLSLPVWAVLIYFSFGLFIFRNSARLANVIEGGWLFAIVATESLAILGALIAPQTGSFCRAVFVLVHLLWGLGAGLYGIYVTLLSYRLFYIEVSPNDLTPVLWVVMGAAAISTNAGSNLLLTNSPFASLAALRPFIEGVTLVLWAWASFWIPLLVLFGIWKHAVRRLPLSYSPMLWGIVFPLGMFSVASLRLSLAEDYPPLHALSAAAMWVSFAAWIGTFLGLANATRRDFWKFMRGRAR